MNYKRFTLWFNHVFFSGFTVCLLCVALASILTPRAAEAGWKSKAALVVATKAIPHAIKASSPKLKKKAHEAVISAIRKHPELIPEIRQRIIGYAGANPQYKAQALKLLERIRPRAALPAARSASEWRNLAGTATGKARQYITAGDKWLRGSHGNAGSVPGQIADELRGKPFKSFDEFRSALWAAVGNDSVLSKGWSRANLSRMKKGKAPFASQNQTHGAIRSYQLHHKTPINQGGSVYDMDNIIIVTPRLHREILDKGYHYGK